MWRPRRTDADISSGVPCRRALTYLDIFARRHLDSCTQKARNEDRVTKENPFALRALRAGGPQSRSVTVAEPVAERQGKQQVTVFFSAQRGAGRVSTVLTRAFESLASVRPGRGPASLALPGPWQA